MQIQINDEFDGVISSMRTGSSSLGTDVDPNIQISSQSEAMKAFIAQLASAMVLISSYQARLNSDITSLEDSQKNLVSADELIASIFSAISNATGSSASSYH